MSLEETTKTRVATVKHRDALLSLRCTFQNKPWCGYLVVYGRIDAGPWLRLRGVSLADPLENLVRAVIQAYDSHADYVATLSTNCRDFLDNEPKE